MIDLAGKRVILVGGPGGVGKTTLAAALGIQLALRGERTVVLTVDPARRLAQALGLGNFEKDLQQVTLPQAPNATLFATMLDAERYFDKLIDKFARSPEQKEKILKNPIYRTMVDHLGGTHEYAAMERLLEFAKDSRFDRVVVDTPPTQNAVDLFSAPQRLADFMDNSVLKWFQGPQPAYFRLFKQGTQLAMKVVQKIFGAEFLDTFSNFLSEMEGMQSGFRTRHLEVMKLLQSEETAFLSVTVPTEGRFQESVSFVEKLREYKIRLQGLVLNQIENGCPEKLSSAVEISAPHRKEIDRWLAYQHAVSSEQQRWIAAFQKGVGKVPVILIPRQRERLHELSTLSHLGQLLVK